MKIRNDYVTNSSSSSFIICFARIADEEKARAVIEKYGLDVFNKKEVEDEKNWCGELGASWCGAVIYDVDKILEAHPEDGYIIIRDSNDAIEDEYGNVEYDYDFGMNSAIDDVKEENGFADIDVAEGKGRNG